MKITEKKLNENIFMQAFEEAARDPSGINIETDTTVAKSTDPFKVFEILAIDTDGIVTICQAMDNGTFGPNQVCHISELVCLKMVLKNYVAIFTQQNGEPPFGPNLPKET